MTDGYVGNDMAIIDAVQTSAGRARVFSFGIGTSVNRFLLDRMARAGRGEVHYILNPKQAQGAAERFYERVRTPVLTDIRLDLGNLPIEEIYPRAIPDLFDAGPIVITGRYKRACQGTITLRGHAGQGPFERRIQVDLPGEQPSHESLASLWARAKIEHLMEQDWGGSQRGTPKPAIKEEVTGLGLSYGLLTQYTSFVAIEKKQVVKNGQLQTIAVPVEMPEGVSHEGVFGEQERSRRSPYAVKASGLGRFAGVRGGMGGGMGGMGGFAPAAASPLPAMAPPRVYEMPRAAKEAPAEVEAKASPREKLAPELRDLGRKLRALGTANLRSGKLHVRNGRVGIKVELTTSAAAVLAKLKELGFQQTARPNVSTQLLGTIAVEKLETLAALEEVVRIEASP